MDKVKRESSAEELEKLKQAQKAAEVYRGQSAEVESDNGAGYETAGKLRTSEQRIDDGTEKPRQAISGIANVQNETDQSHEREAIVAPEEIRKRIITGALNERIDLGKMSAKELTDWAMGSGQK